MLITDDIFQAFLQCETKAHLKLAGAVGDQQGVARVGTPPCRGLQAAMLQAMAR